MPKTVWIDFAISADENGNPEKLLKDTKPHAKRGDDVLWKIKNDFGADITVDLQGLDPTYVDMQTALPLVIPDGKKRPVLANIINAQANKAKTITYFVYINGTQVDPDLIIDGDNVIGKGKKKDPKKAPKTTMKKAGAKAGKKR